MIKNAILIISNLFNFARPSFMQLRYAHFVIDDNAFFLISWEIKNGYRLKIGKLNYRTSKPSGSAYIAVPDPIDQVDLVISNLWRSDRVPVVLIRQTVSMQVDFYPEKQFRELTAKAIYSPQIKLRPGNPKMTTQITHVHIPKPTINNQNLNQA